MRNFLIALFCLNTYFLASQISFTNLPKDKQLFGRDFQTNYGTIQISGEVNVGDNYNLQYSSWAPGEPNNNPDPENAADSYEFNGNTYYFCCSGCKEKFALEPSSFID